MTANITITLPEKVILKIDKDRQDINRSKFVLMLIEKAYNLSTKKSIEENSEYD